MPHPEHPGFGAPDDYVERLNDMAALLARQPALRQAVSDRIATLSYPQLRMGGGWNTHTPMEFDVLLLRALADVLERAEEARLDGREPASW